jgi:hypothetical protein
MLDARIYCYLLVYGHRPDSTQSFYAEEMSPFKTILTFNTIIILHIFSL